MTRMARINLFQFVLFVPFVSNVFSDLLWFKRGEHFNEPLASLFQVAVQGEGQAAQVNVADHDV